MNKLCKPTVAVANGQLGGDFDDELRRTQEILKQALDKVLPDL
jgi:hypothetical protein